MITNLIGQALIVLSVNCYTNMGTNSFYITCEEAGCTNKTTYTNNTTEMVIVELEGGYGGILLKGESCFTCWMSPHTKEVVYPVAVVKEIIFGTSDGTELLKCLVEHEVKQVKKRTRGEK